MSDDNAKPDAYSNAWYRTQFRGVMHLLNRSAAEYEDCWEAVKELRARVDSLEVGRREDMAEIGRLSAECEELKAAMGKVKAALQGLRKQVTNTETQP